MTTIGITERGDAALDGHWRAMLPNVDGVILITKAPHLIDWVPSNGILHCTITGYGGTKLEPGVADYRTTIDAYLEWVKKIGSERCVLRVDPIVPTPKGIARAQEILRFAVGRVRISFLDMYPHVETRFKNARLPVPDFYYKDGRLQLHAPLEIRQQALCQLRTTWDNLEICAEPGMDCAGCVSVKDLAAMGLSVTVDPGKSQQRKHCHCLAIKRELLDRKGQCSHCCAYCYWR